MQNPIESARNLKEELAKVLVGEIGSYQRPSPLLPMLAIFVGDRSVPAGSKMIVTPIEANPVVRLPSLEVIINSRPQYISKGRNFGSRLVDESWQIWLIFHDSRQNPKQAIFSIMANFNTAGDVTYLPQADKISPEQYTLSIARKSQVFDR